MANQTHRLLVDGELHRPERSGFGNPNNLELTNVENGQYFQDETTGSVYRYNGDSDTWELLVGYDRDNQRITNIGAQTVDGKIGELTVGAGVAPPAAEVEGAFEVTGQKNVIVTQLSANLFVPVETGDEIKLISVENESVERYVTVVEGAESGGEVTIDIQDDLFRQYFPIGSHIILDGAQFEAKFSVDPSRIVLKVNEERELSEFGTLVPPDGAFTEVGENLETGPQLQVASTNVSADNPVRVAKGEKIQVYEPFIDGETRVQEFTVSADGVSTFTSSPFFIPVEETTFTQIFTTKALVREPAFSSSSRISVLSDEIVLKVDSNGNIAAITLSGNADDGSQITIVADDVDINNINFNKENGTIGSNNYVEDVSGWQIEGNGDAEFNSIKIRDGIIVGSVDAGSYVPGNTGIRIVDELPATGEEGDVVFLTTESKLYRWTGSEWTAAVETVELVGQITETQITDDSISTPKLRANAVTANEIAANAVTANELSANSVTADKILAGAVTAAKIDVSELSAITANLGTITAGSISAGIITSGTIDTARLNVEEITVGLITGDEVDENVTSITGNAITTGTVSANRIDVSGVISAGSIVVGGDGVSRLTNDSGYTDFDAGDVQAAIDNNVTVISGSKIATGTINASLVDVTNLNADNITTGSIDASRVSASNLQALSASTGSLSVSGTLTMGGSGIIKNSTSDFQVDSDGFRVNTGSSFLEAGAYTLYRGGALKGSLSSLTIGSQDRIQLDSLDGYNLRLQANGLLELSGSRIDMLDDFELRNFSSSNGMRFGLGGDDDFFMAPLNSGSPDFSREFRWDRAAVEWRFDEDLHVGGTFSNPSDQRYKENFEPLESSLDNIMQLQTVKYDMKDFLPNDQRRMIGVFAQEIEQFYPEAVKESTITDDDGNEHELKSVSYTQLVPILIHAIQQLKQQLDERSNTP